jgi:hypothetical protein
MKMSEAQEVIFEEVQQEAEPAKAVQTESEQPKTETETPSEQTAADKTFTQAELDEIVQKRIAKLERKLDKQRIESETRAKVLAEVNQPKEEAPSKPIPDNFTTTEDYLEALAEYKADQKFAELTQKQKDAERETKYKSEVERQNERKADMIRTGEGKYDDFEDIVANARTEISEPAYLAILETDNAADIVYHLAKHPAEADRIAALSPYAQAKEIGKLEDKLASKPVKLSNAPTPMTQVKGAQSIPKSIEDMTLAEYEKDAIARGARWVR